MQHPSAMKRAIINGEIIKPYGTKLGRIIIITQMGKLYPLR